MISFQNDSERDSLEMIVSPFQSFAKFEQYATGLRSMASGYDVVNNVYDAPKENIFVFKFAYSV